MEREGNWQYIDFLSYYLSKFVFEFQLKSCKCLFLFQVIHLLSEVNTFILLVLLIAEA